MPIFHSRKYTLNEDFFSLWSRDMAYVLGFWFADGYMRHDKSYGITFYSNDHDILHEINRALNSNSPLYNHTRHVKARTLTVRSKKLYGDLTTLGGVTAKSRILTFPFVPETYIRDFIRGYFDGDGSVHLISSKSSKNGKIYTNVRSNFTSGSKNFLESLRTVLIQKLGLSNRKICQFGPFQFKLGFNQKDTLKLLVFLYYPGHNLSLSRKAKYLDLALSRSAASRENKYYLR